VPATTTTTAGVAALLEIVRYLHEKPTARSWRFFVDEETLFFCTWDMGSHRHARRVHERGE